ELVVRASCRGLPMVTYSLDDTSADFTVRDVHVGSTGNRFVVLDRRDGSTMSVDSPLVGHFNVMNALGAAATARTAGFPTEAISTGLSAPMVIPGRLERIVSEPFTVVVDYAHTPAALRHVLRAARLLCAPTGRVIALFGCGG